MSDLRAISGDAFRQAMRQVPSAVAVVTAEHKGQRRGLTATAVCSVSADPPQVLACVNKAGRAHACIEQANAFGINYLSDSQAPLALAFSRAGEESDVRFDGDQWSGGAQGVPLLESAVVSFACRVAQRVDCGTHSIFIGEIVEVRQHERGSLLYKSGTFSHA